jgi:uncharacterized lipoprotein YddW (UPF0748 family)
MAMALFMTLCSAALGSPSYVYVPSQVQPPPPKREFRGVWIASVGNIDWPSQPGLTTQQQKSELIGILDRAAYLRLNAVILQIRPSCDALYASPIEPWSEYLTGQMGQAPNPYYDPLAFAVEEAHRRGIELHAWFNPFRARTQSARSPIPANHVSKLHPDWVKSYNGYLWLDPGDTNVQAYILKVFLDVVHRYDIDAVHIDDYFYAPEEKVNGKVTPFPDGPSWKRYVDSGGRMSRDDWRRSNVDNTIQRLYEAIKAEKPCVKFGVSPAGIWRPGNPPQIRGFDLTPKYSPTRANGSPMAGLIIFPRNSIGTSTLPLKATPSSSNGGPNKTAPIVIFGPATPSRKLAKPALPLKWSINFS